MKEVTIENVKARIALLEGTERACGLTLKGEFELACLRNLVGKMAIESDVHSVINLLANNEWAEHCTTTVLGSMLEAEVTRLVGRTQPAPVDMKEHQIRELVNELRDVAVEYHGTQQLRERIAHTVRAAMLNQTQEPAIDNTAQQFEALATSNAHDCLWSYDSHQGTWHGKCGVYWVFMDDGPDENGMKFCPGCGKPVATTSAGSGKQ